jgi:hypothetical protein
MPKPEEIDKMSTDEVELEIKRQQLHEIKHQNHLRLYFTKPIFWISIGWIFVIIIITILNGCNILHLKSPELVALITTTTINVFAFFIIVVKYIFPNKKE